METVSEPVSSLPGRCFRTLSLGSFPLVSEDFHPGASVSGNASFKSPVRGIRVWSIHQCRPNESAWRQNQSLLQPATASLTTVRVSPLPFLDRCISASDRSPCPCVVALSSLRSTVPGLGCSASLLLGLQKYFSFAHQHRLAPMLRGWLRAFRFRASSTDPILCCQSFFAALRTHRTKHSLAEPRGRCAGLAPGRIVSQSTACVEFFLGSPAVLAPTLRRLSPSERCDHTFPAASVAIPNNRVGCMSLTFDKNPFQGLSRSRYCGLWCLQEQVSKLQTHREFGRPEAPYRVK